MNKVNFFPALTSPFPLILFSNLPIADEALLVANLDKTYLINRTARSSA